MKRIKKGIVKDFDSIAHTPKEEMLKAAGAPLQSKPHTRRIAPTKLIPISVAAAILLSLSAMLTLAESGGDIYIQIQNFFMQEKDEKQESLPPIEKSSARNNEFHVMLDDRIDETISYYKSVGDLVADVGDGLYYPSYSQYENAFYTSVIRTGQNTLQIEYPLENHEIFWISPGTTFAGESMNPYAEKYESHGTVFYICPYSNEGPNGFGGHHVEGILDGTCYSFFTTDKEKAMLIIDSLKKAE